MTEPVQYPHCDSRVLHAPGECDYCDHHPDWQAQRIAGRVCFTGWDRHRAAWRYGGFPDGWSPCPADAERPPGSPSDHRRWGGNKPTSAKGDPSWPQESVASLVMYGDQGGRQQWPLIECIAIRIRAPWRRWQKRRAGWKRDSNGWWHYP